MYLFRFNEVTPLWQEQAQSVSPFFYIFFSRIFLNVPRSVREILPYLITAVVIRFFTMPYIRKVNGLTGVTGHF